MSSQQSLLNELNIDPVLLQKALETGKGNNTLISDLINLTLKSYINKSVLEARGFKETVFHLPKNKEVKKLFVKSIAKHEIKHNPHDHVDNPNFSGVVYPSTLIEIFVSPKANILIKKSINREVHFSNGQIVHEQMFNRTIDLIISSDLEDVITKVPELSLSLSAAYPQQDLSTIRSELDEDFFQELVL